MQDDYIKEKYLQYKKAENIDKGQSFLQRMVQDVAVRDFSSKVSQGFVDLNDPNLSVLQKLPSVIQDFKIDEKDLQRSIFDLKNVRFGRAESTAKEKYAQRESENYTQKLTKLMIEQKEGLLLKSQENKLKEVFGKKLTRVLIYKQAENAKSESVSPIKIRSNSVLN